MQRSVPIINDIMSTRVQVYIAGNSTPRLEYAADLVLGNILGLDYEIISSTPDPDRPLVNYSDDRSIGGIFIQPEKLLFETGIHSQDIWIAHMGDIPLFFQQPPEAGFFIDIFAFAFYMVTRYEEYLQVNRDEHGRYPAELSMAYKHNFLDRPVVDIWALRFGHTLGMLYPTLKINTGSYDSLLTVDVDQPFSYKGKGLIRNIGGLLLDIRRGKDISLRFRCMAGNMKDPFNTFDYINRQATEKQTNIIYFLSAGKRSKYDKNPDPLRKCYRRLIRSMTMKYKTGIHPSYYSNMHSAIVAREKSVLERAGQKLITSARNHYLLLKLPETYRSFIEAGIETDYTMGFVREPGFRAGIARPFLFYDLEREKTTGLRVVPFQYMDGTLQQYKRLTNEEAKKVIGKLINETREVGGLFVSLWHNTSLTETDEWKGWRRIFEFTLEEGMK